MSWFISEILKPFKSLAVIIINSKRQKRDNLVTWYKLAFHFLIEFKAAVKKMY